MRLLFVHLRGIRGSRHQMVCEVSILSISQIWATNQTWPFLSELLNGENARKWSR